MIIVMKHGAGQREIEAVEKGAAGPPAGGPYFQRLRSHHYRRDRDKSALAGVNLEMMDGVDKCVPIMHSYKLASREICPRAAR